MNRQCLLAKVLFLTFAGSLFLTSCQKDETTSPTPEEPKERPVTEESSMYVTQLFEFVPAPGQFINKAPGDLVSAESILGKRGSVSLGAWGGYVILGFDHTVKNREGDDIVIYGNPPSATFSEPGIIYVMPDANGNGVPDDTWYEIAGSDFGKEGYIRNYEVTYSRPDDAAADIPWKDNQGNTGVIARNSFHNQNYYPDWIKENEYTLKGARLSSDNIDMSNPGMITSQPLEYGYADNKEGGDKIDLSDAVDKDGKKITLDGIDFIKIQTGILANMGWLGELSTEVMAVADLSLVPKSK